MLSSNRHVTLRHTVFEIFEVKWPKYRPKYSDLWDPVGTPPPKGEKTCAGPICTIVQNFTLIGATVAVISVTGHREKNSKLSCHTNVWQVKRQQNICVSVLQSGTLHDIYCK